MRVSVRYKYHLRQTTQQPTGKITAPVGLDRSACLRPTRLGATTLPPPWREKPNKDVLPGRIAFCA